MESFLLDRVSCRPIIHPAKERTAMTTRLCTSLVALFASCWLAPVLHGQSLGDVANAEAKRRASIATPAKVITEKDLKAQTGPVDPDTPAVAVTGVPAKTSASTAPPTSTELEEMRVDAAELFGARVKALRIAVDERDAKITRYQDACAGKMTTGGPMVFVSGWSAAIVPSTINNETTPQCRLLLSELVSQSDAIRMERSGIEESGRVKKIYPGVIRDLFAAAGLR
jgi:hypothetical protein